MGVTYSWLKRRSVRANPVSPGLTASTPTLPAPCSMWRAKIFSAMVIGRGLVSIGGRKTLPCRRATLNGNSPPYSMTWRVISSSPSVNSLSGISSPPRILSMSEKSVEVSTPRFWQFCL